MDWASGLLGGMAGSWSLLGEQERALVLSMACLTAAAVTVNLASKIRVFSQSTEIEDDPYQIVLTEPVGVGGDQEQEMTQVKESLTHPYATPSNPSWLDERRKDRLYKMIQDGRTCARCSRMPEAETKGIPPEPPKVTDVTPTKEGPKRSLKLFTQSIPRAPKKTSTEPIRGEDYASVVHHDAGVFTTSNASPKILQVPPAPDPAPLVKISPPPHPFAPPSNCIITELVPAPAAPKSYSVERMLLPVYTAVAEYDFLKSMTVEEARRLRMRFGFVCVPQDTWLKAEKLPDFPRWANVLVKVKVVDDESPYLSVAYAKKTRALVLTDSVNIRRVCERQNIPCVSRDEWRRQEATA